MLHSKDEILNAIGRKSSLLVLLYVHHHPDCSQTEVMNNTEGDNFRTKFVRIKELIEVGLLVIDHTSRHNTTSLRTTDKGRRLCTALELILEESE